MARRPTFRISRDQRRRRGRRSSASPQPRRRESAPDRARLQPWSGLVEAFLGQSSVHRCQCDEQNTGICSTFRTDDGARTHDLLHGKCERPFAPVRARSLKQLFCRVRVQASERERTRANAEPCHSCHGIRCRSRRRCPPRCTRTAPRRPTRYRLQAKPGSPVLGRRSYFTQSWSSRTPHCGLYW